MATKWTNIWLVYLLTTTIFLHDTEAQKPVDWKDREILVDESEDSALQGNRRVSLKSGYPLRVHGIAAVMAPGSPEQQAREYLLSHREELGLSESVIHTDLILSSIRNGLSGEVVRLDQYYRDIPVYQGQITIHINNDDQVTFLSNAFKYGIENVPVNRNITFSAALDQAIKRSGVITPTTFKKEEWLIFPYGSEPRLAIRQVLAGQDATGEWEIITDGNTGEILKLKNTSFNCKSTEPHVHENSHHALPLMINGTGNIFDPDPLSSASANYGDPGFSDNGDSTSPELDGEMVNVVLNDITLDMGMHQLKGPFAEIVDFEQPFKGLFSQASSAFTFNRSDDAFEAVNVYYHIDASMRYLNNTLGLSIMPYQYVGGVKADPSGQNGADNSQYQGGAGRLTFGEGGVDDAEDSDVIHHELGHGLHDWVTNGSLSQVNGLSEGTGDYWAASYNRSLGDWVPTDPQYYWVFNWDGHNQFWNGRSTNYRPTFPAYPDGLTGSIHTDGQIWATCMLDVWEGLGKTKTDMIFWEGLGMTNSSSNQDDAANAVYQAAIDMGFTRMELEYIHLPLTKCGYSLPDLPTRDCNATDLNLSGMKTTDEEYVASQNIISSQQISNNVTVLFQADGNEVFEFPFEVEPGSSIILRIEECVDP